MTTFTKFTVLLAGTALLALTACSTAATAHPKSHDKAQMSEKHQGMSHEKMGSGHDGMMQQMKMDHDKMSKMDMSKMDMSKLSTECQTMMTKMKAKMAEKHKDGGAHSGMKDHDMMKMDGHDSDKMKAKMAKHKKCMAEMKEAMPHSH